MSKKIKKFKNRSHLVNSLIFMVITLTLVAGNAIAEHFLASYTGDPLHWGIFTIATGGDYSNHGAGDFGANTNPLLFSFIEIPKMASWITYTTSVFVLLLVATSVIFIKKKSTIVFVSMLVAALGGNLIDAIFLDPADFVTDPVSGSVIFERNFYIEWLGGIGMNLMDMIALFGTAGFLVFWMVRMIVFAIRGRTIRASEADYDNEVHEYAEDIKKEIPNQKLAEEMVDVVVPLINSSQDVVKIESEHIEKKPEVAPMVVEVVAPVAPQPEPKPVDRRVESPVYKQTRQAPQPVEVKPTPAPTMSEVKPVVPTPMETPTPVVTPTPEAPVFKQERQPKPAAVATPKTQEEIEEEEMRASLSSLKDSW